eukprot:161994_1
MPLVRDNKNQFAFCISCSVEKLKLNFSKNQWKKGVNAKCIECVQSFQRNKENRHINTFRRNKDYSAKQKSGNISTEPLRKENCHAFLYDQVVTIFNYPDKSSLTSSIVDIISNFMYLQFSGKYIYQGKNELFETDMHHITLTEDYSYNWIHHCFANNITSESWKRSGKFSIVSHDVEFEDQNNEIFKIMFMVNDKGIHTKVVGIIYMNKYGKNRILKVMDRINIHKTWVTLQQEE